MPGYNLQVDGHRVQNLKVEPDRTGLGGIGGAITGEAPKRFKVSGTYVIDVKNTGITPALFASVNIAGLSLGGKQLLSDTSTGMPVISGGGTSTATFEFQTTTEDDAFLSDVQSACSSNTLKANTQGRVEGIILGALVNKIGEVKIESTNCTFPQGGSNIEDPGGPGNGGSGGNGGNNGDGGGEPGEGELVIQDSPQDDGTARYTIEGTYNAANVRFNWEMGDGESKRGRTVTHSYNENDRYDVSCEVIDGALGGRLDYMETSVRVTGLQSGGRPGEEGPRSIEVLEEPGRDGQARFRMGGEYEAIGAEFIWDMDESDLDSFNQNAEGREVQYEFDSNGTYLVRCRVVDTFTGNILAEDGEEVVVNISGAGGGNGPTIEGPSIVVEGMENTWSISSGESGSWEMGDGESYSNQSEVTHTYQFQGPQTIQYSSGGIFGVGETTAEFNVQVEPNVDDGPVGGLSGELPTLGEAAESKDREF